MSKLRLILEQPRPKGKTHQIVIIARDDVPIHSLILALVQCLQLPQRDIQGNPLTYQITLIANGMALPTHQSLTMLGIQPGTRVRLEVRQRTLHHDERASLAVQPLSDRKPGQQKISRRTLVTTGGILVTCSLSGLFSGAATALAQRRWSSVAQQSSPIVQQKPLTNPPTPLRLTIQHMFRFTGHRGTVRTIAFSPDGNLLVSGADDAQLLLWTPNGTIRHTIQHSHAIHAVAWSPGGQRLATGSGNTVAFLAVENGKFLATPPPQHTAIITGLAWSSEQGHPIVSSGLDKRAVVWETTHYQRIGVFTKHTRPIEAVAVTPGNGATIATVSQGGVVRLWDINTRQERHGFYQSTRAALHTTAFSPQGTILVVGAHDGMVHIWEQSLACQHIVETIGEQQCIDIPRQLIAHVGAVRTLAFSPDGRLLATGGDDGQIILWNVRAGFELVTKITHAGPVHSCSWSPDGRILAVATGNVVQLWNLAE